MNLLRDVSSLKELNKGVVATIGNFDGVHLGHQNLITNLRNKANSLNIPLVVILFEPQPREYFQKGETPPRISSLREKLDILQQLQVDYVYCIKFNSQLAQTSATDFAHHYLFNTLKVNFLLVGEDFRFGKDREGDVSLLKTLGAQYSCEVQNYPDFCFNNEKVSSTKIRWALGQDTLDLAAQLLGRTYSMCGRVIRGDGRGRQWGIPTANIGLHRLSLPIKGVFAVEVLIGTQKVLGVANIGTRPTVDGTKNILEVHLFDFHTSIYGTLVQVFFLHKLRDEIKFSSVDLLLSQIHHDIAAAKAILKVRS